MAEAIPYDIVSILVMKLGSSAFQEFGLMYGVKKELKKLGNTLSTINAMLLDAEEKQVKSHAVRNWIRRLQEVIYDADDVLDDFATNDLRHKVDTRGKVARQVCDFFSSSNQLAYSLKLGYRVKEIRERLDEVALDISKFNFRERVLDVDSRVDNRRETDSFVLKSEIVGREKNKEEIIELLLHPNNNENVSIVAIVGLGGLGKTTLAQLVCNDKKVEKLFEKRMWVWVSREFEVKVVVKKILKSVTGEEVGELDLEQLQIRLRENLEEKRYLLILDDMWDGNNRSWDHLKKFLLGGASGSKILVTTRSKQVASFMGINFPYVLEGLREDESWTLFKQVAFRGAEEEVLSNLEEIGKEVVKRCKGVPLAIKTLGSAMQSKTNGSQWLSILENEVWKLSQNDDDIFPVLKLSYAHLPIHLRECFSYCSVFPKDSEIDKMKLIQLWIALGYIQSSKGSEDLEKIGNEYFNELLSRSFFEEVEESSGDDMKVYKMHDLIHDLAQSVAGSSCSIVNSKADNVSESVHHVSFECMLTLPRHLLKAKAMRTFLLPFYSGFGETSTQDAVFTNFKRLRVLNLSSSGIQQLSNSVGKLKHLRYLDFSYNDQLEILPCSLSNLLNLQTLDLTGCGSLKELPSDTRKLISLKNLMIDGCGRLEDMPSGLGRLTSLQRLSRFIVARNQDGSSGASGTLSEFKCLNHLRDRIHLENLENVRNTEFESKEADFKEKKNLQCLRLTWGSREEANDGQSSELLLENLQPHSNLEELWVEGYGGKRYPSWLSLIINLTKVIVKDSEKCLHLPPLDQLPRLKILNLEKLKDLEYISDHSTSATLFPSLRQLTLLNCPKLRGWWRGSSINNYINVTGTSSTAMTDLPSFPCLSKLSIRNCPKLTSMPLYPSLEDLILSRASSKPLQQTMMMTAPPTAASTSSSSSSHASLSSLSLFPPLSKLKSLYIWSVEDLEFLLEESLCNLSSLQELTVVKCPKLRSFPGEGFRASTSLKSLRIGQCDRLKSLSGILQHLTALEKLTIEGCKELDSSDSMQWQELRSLSSLTIFNFPQLVSLPEGLQHAITLKHVQISACQGLRSLSPVLQHLRLLEYLDIRWCDELDLSDAGIQLQDLSSLRVLHLQSIPRLVNLPEWLQHIITLKRLQIIGCHNLVAFPEWIGTLTSLQRLLIDESPQVTSMPDGLIHLTALEILSIYRCPELSERCKNNMAEDWPKIAHIPSISVDRKWIRSRGRYQLE